MFLQRLLSRFSLKVSAAIALVVVVAFSFLSITSTVTYAQSAKIQVNQTGYLPTLQKLATLANGPSGVQSWQLKNSFGAVVATGTTTVLGFDSTSNDNIQLIDFSAYQTAGNGYTLTAGGVVSPAFDIRTSVYHSLKYDALAYFYHNRSGIAITMPYAGGTQWTRPAGHIQVSPNQGDKSVPCASDAGCSYSLDVSGGWYDAGDQGKYVVNGGISVWTLMNQYERAQYLGSSVADFADGKMNIPENANGVPDLLDEARWEMNFILEMQVPAGQPHAGMVHHKMHDANWTGIPLRPDQDPQPRVLRPVSTAATLNLAATAAQCARIWRTIDSTFSTRCLNAAQTAWNAAQANPAIYASDSDGTGGGAYGDSNVTDEFYWAAAELYITTGSSNYLNYLQSSSLYKVVPVGMSSMDWGSTQTLGDISLAVVPNSLPAADVTSIRNNIVSAAGSYLATLNNQGYRVPISTYDWGSNSFVANDGMIMALAYDFSHDSRYLSGAAEAMNYLLGRNAMGKSYVSGYGSNPLQNPHHRFWAHQANASFPPPPPGALSGGPNPGLQDPDAKAALSGCAPQKCYGDDYRYYSTNEITINWNAPLAWLAAYLDEKSGTTNGTPVPTSIPTTPAPTDPASVDGTPYSGTAYTIPGKIEAENYNLGGEGVAYHDSDAVNNGGQYRTTDGVDIEATTDTGAGYNVGYTAAGEWMKYIVNVGADGTYKFTFRVASATTGGNFHLEVDNSNVTGSLSVPNTGGWQAWTDVSTGNVSLTAGRHVFKWVTDAAGGNYNFFTVTSGSSTATPNPTFQPPTATPVSGNCTSPSDCVSKMTLAEKIGQMTQVEKNAFTQSGNSMNDITTYYIGSVLSGGGGGPNGQGGTSAQWADMIDGYQGYALKTRLAIPLLYGVDAVHGNNNIYGATLFPHHIGMGATHDTDLIMQAEQVTRDEVLGSGARWAFAPCLCVPQDDRWGRTYEGYSEVTSDVQADGAAAIIGLQGANGALGPTNVLASAKHFVGDGHTSYGTGDNSYLIDRGNAQISEAVLDAVDLPPYQTAIQNKVGSIMASYSSWNGVKMHANQYLLTQVLKGTGTPTTNPTTNLGFQGFVVSDWAAIDEISSDYNYDVRTSINAGVDMVMVPTDYKKFITALQTEINAGNIPMSRIDDAVTRILTAKFALGLFSQPYANRAYTATVGSAAHRAIARKAVQESLVLLKNNSVLPLSKTGTYTLVVGGDHADNLGYQMGGWSISWQGGSGATNVGTTLWQGIQQAGLSPSVTVNYVGTNTASNYHGDVGIVAVGETPYAEGVGDSSTLSLNSTGAQEVADVCSRVTKCIVVLFSGRPIVINTQLNQSAAFVAAWIGSTEGEGIADNLFGDTPFTGKLTFTWPNDVSQEPINKGDGKTGLFPYGYGLTTTVGPTPVPTTPVPTTPSPVDGTPYSGTAYTIPGKVETENYNVGGEGVAYHDSDATNNGGQYRTSDGVDIEASTDTGAGYNVGYTAASEWMKYTVSVTASGSYNFTFRVASATTGGSFHLEVDNVNVTGALSVPNTGGWQSWTNVTANNINLSAGQHIFKWVTDAAGGNYNWFNVTAVTVSTPTPVTPTSIPTTVPTTAVPTFAPPTNTPVGATSTPVPSSTPLPTATQSTSISPTAWYEVINQNSGKCLDDANWGTTNGSIVQQYDCNSSGQNNQEWQFTPTDSGYYKVTSRQAPGLVWDASGSANGAKIQLWSFGGGTNQQWMPVALGGGYYKFVARHTGTCMDVPSASTANSVQLQIWTCNGTTAQSFRLLQQP